ncbi:MAG: DnaD domain-containing protein [Rubrobacteraceae bacterium]
MERAPPGYYTERDMERLKLTPPGERGARGERARLYLRWMPHLGAEAVALYELLRILPDIGRDEADADELAELLRSTPRSVEEAFGALIGAGFVVERDGWLEVADHPPSMAKEAKIEAPNPEESSKREIEVIRAEPEGVSADDYFKFMGTLPAPHIIEFLNGYRERDGVEPDVVREALRIASERDARRVGYVRSILERWVERGVKTLEDVERFEKDRKLRLVEQSGAVKGGALKIAEGGDDGAYRRSAARRREGYEWLFGE